MIGLSTVVLLDAPLLGEAFISPLLSTLDELATDGVDGVLLRAPHRQDGTLDPFVALAAVASEAPLPLGAMIELGEGRAASIAVREATSLEHLSAHRGLLGFMSEAPERLAEALDVATALLTEERATAGGSLESVVDAPNLPQPRQPLLLIGMGPEGVQCTEGPLEIRRVSGLSFGAPQP